MATATKTNWKKAREHQITLPSGAEVVVRIPNLAALAKSGALPNNLVEIALGAARGEDLKVDADLLNKQAELEEFVVLQAVVEPKLTAEDIADIPYEDVEMIFSIATRERDLDAIGKHIGGLDKVSDFRRFRGLDDE